MGFRKLKSCKVLRLKFIKITKTMIKTKTNTKTKTNSPLLIIDYSFLVKS